MATGRKKEKTQRIVTKGFDPEEFLKVFESNLGLVTQACRQYGMSRENFYKWMENLPGFEERVEEVRESVKDMGESALYKLIKEGNPKAVIFFNETRNKDRGYVRQSEQKVTLDGDTVIDINFE